MKHFLSILVPVFLLFGCLEGRSQQQARVIRLVSKNDGSQWYYSVNRSNRAEVVSRSELTNRIARLGLRQGDIVLYGGVARLIPSQLAEVRVWLEHCFNSNRVAVYVHPYSTNAVDVFSVSAYHWVAPFDNPRGLGQATFFHEGTFLGEGMAGFQKLVDGVRQSHERRIFILGSLYDHNRGFGSTEVPFEDQQQLLDDALAQSGKIRLLPAEIPGF